MTKRVKYTAIWNFLIPDFPPSQFDYFPSSFFFSSSSTFFFYFPSSISFSLLLHNFIIIPSPPPPSHLFYKFFHPQIHRPHIDPASTLDSFFVFQHNFVDMYMVKLYTTTTTFLLFLLFTKLTFFDYFNRISNLNGGIINWLTARETLILQYSKSFLWDRIMANRGKKST